MMLVRGSSGRGWLDERRIEVWFPGPCALEQDDRQADEGVRMDSVEVHSSGVPEYVIEQCLFHEVRLAIAGRELLKELPLVRFKQDVAAGTPQLGQLKVQLLGLPTGI